MLSAAKPGEQVIDLCAGAGGKTLALAAMMQGKGRLIATDHDKRQLAPIYERLSRAGVHNCDVRTPKGPNDTLSDIHASADLVLIDAPCTGTGTWRRNPDAKWRMRPGALEVRLKDQVAVLDRAAALAKPGGRIAYITCSVLPQENGEQIRAFVARHPEFAVVPPEQTAAVLWDKAEDFAAAALQSPEGWLMTPRRTGTDGFFVSVLKRATARSSRHSGCRSRHSSGRCVGAPRAYRSKPHAIRQTPQVNNTYHAPCQSPRMWAAISAGCERRPRRVIAIHDSPTASRTSRRLGGLGA